MAAPARVLVVDDSATARGALVALLALEKGILVVAEASDGAHAALLAKSMRPDVITMDLQMPGMSGLDAIRSIMADAPARILVVCSVGAGNQVDLSLRATAAGALELIAKPKVEGPEDLRAFGRKVGEAIRVFAEVPVVTRRRQELVNGRPAPLLVHAPGTLDAIGIVASTGGPAALAALLAALPRDFPAPVLIAQHIARGFGAGLLRWFAEVSPLSVRSAEHGALPRVGSVYLPPDGYDLEVAETGAMQLIPNASDLCPSGNKLLLSLAHVYGSRAAGVVLTGMGEDGALGLLAIRTAGGPTLAQDEASSVVFGMPQAAQRLGAAEQLLSIEQIAVALKALAKR